MSIVRVYVGHDLSISGIDQHQDEKINTVTFGFEKELVWSEDKAVHSPFAVTSSSAAQVWFWRQGKPKFGTVWAYLYRTGCWVETNAAESRRPDHPRALHSTASIMKTLCVTLALLLLTVCCIDALREWPFSQPCCVRLLSTGKLTFICFILLTAAAVNFSAAPRSCCFKFNTKNLPRRVVSDVTETHSQCENKAFM